MIAITCALVGAACSSGVSESAPATTTTDATTTTSTTEPLTIEQQVEEAYLYSWEVYAEALADPTEPVELDKAFAGRALELRMGDVERVALAHQAVRVDVEHDYSVELIDVRTAVVLDAYTNHMVLIDPESQTPLEDDPNQLVTNGYTLELFGERWLVTAVNEI